MRMRYLILMRSMNKGLVLSLNAFLWGLVILMSIVFLFWFFVSHYISIQDSIIEETRERYLNDLLNIIISNPKYCFVDAENKIYRDVLDITKISEEFIEKDDYKSKKSSISLRETEISYPNSMYIVQIIDMNNGNGWISFYKSDIIDEKYNQMVNDIFRCIKNEIADNMDEIFTWDDEKNSIKMSICDYRLISSCLEETYAKSYGGFLATKGIPLIIRYDNDKSDIGRMFGCLIIFDESFEKTAGNINIHVG